MKIAICISGFMRYYEKNIISLKKFLPYDFDIFIHTWNTQDHHTNNLLDQEKIIDLYQPKSVIFEELKIFIIKEI